MGATLRRHFLRAVAATVIFCQSRCGDALSLSVAADAIRIRLEAVISDHADITKETCSDIGMGTLILCLRVLESVRRPPLSISNVSFYVFQIGVFGPSDAFCES